MIDSSYDKSYYEQKNIWDGDIATAWVEGVKGNGINEWVIIDYMNSYDMKIKTVKYFRLKEGNK